MAIDTPNKRKSALNLGIPGAFFMPVPDGTIDSMNRRQMTESYALTPQTISRNFWVQDRDSSQTWAQDQNSSQTWVQDQDSSLTWVPDEEIEES